MTARLRPCRPAAFDRIERRTNNLNIVEQLISAEGKQKQRENF